MGKRNRIKGNPLKGVAKPGMYGHGAYDPYPSVSVQQAQAHVIRQMTGQALSANGVRHIAGDPHLPEDWRERSYRYNFYLAEFPELQFGVLTVDVAEGVAPTHITLGLVRGLLNAPRFWWPFPDAVELGSQDYPRDRPIPDFLDPPLLEFYVPDPEEIGELDPATLDYVAQGGLLIRPRTEATPVEF